MNQRSSPGSPSADAVEVLLEVIATICALLPIGFVVAAFRSLYPEGWLKFPAVWGILAVVLLLAVCWYRVATKTRHRAMLSGFFAAAACVVGVRTDWIVVAQYSFMGNVSMNSYEPPRSPVWDPPRHEQLEPGTTSWRDYPFFYNGGAGGPVEEPRLEVEWVGVTFRLTAFTVVPFLALSGILWLMAKLRRRRLRENQTNLTGFS